MPDTYANIRDHNLLGAIIGAKVVDVTQHDREEFQEEGACYFVLHFDNGVCVRVYVGDDGFDILNVPDQPDGTVDRT